ncbi:MAG: radical SAM protein [Firmicutes bacterium]|nr:radical SAM protein [Bacillota bacterium]
MELGAEDKLLANCELCPRNCHVDRTKGQLGFCNAGYLPKVARVATHHWEEPPISGERGSGTIFFSHCNLKCCYCQNYQISHEGFGKEITIPELAQKFLFLQSQGAHNINLVTGACYVPQIAQAINIARAIGLAVPVIYNTSAYEKVETLQLLEGLVNVYLPDLKYIDPELGKTYSGAANYFAIASSAIQEMVRQCGPVKLDENGLIRSGVLVRHLILPSATADSIRCLEWIKYNLPKDVYLSLMAQYLPLFKAKDHPPLNRRITEAEYNLVVDKAVDLGFEEGFIQDLDAASAEFIPKFDLTGLEHATPLSLI